MFSLCLSHKTITPLHLIATFHEKSHLKLQNLLLFKTDFYSYEL